ncbi:MAG: PAS domain-containing protein [Rhodospirillaceae bacterium]|nr:PAS domain-containing protein [Rhodospirillaceae bacterium]MBT5666820.1 PAS domain-containing protein [Rhodospirillaceae bacterium]
MSKTEERLRAENAALKRQIVELQGRVKAAASRENESLYTTILDNLPTPVSLKEADGRYLFVNKVFAERRGMTVNQIKGKTSSFLWPNETTEHFETRDEELRQTGQSVEVETESLGIDGVLRIYRGIKFPIFHADGKLAAIGSVHIDITERKRAEHGAAEKTVLLQAILDAAPATIAFRNLKNQFVFMNEQMATLIGGQLEDFVGKTSTEIRGVIAGETVEAMAASVLETKQPIIDREFFPPRNPEKFARYSVVPVFENGDILLGTVAIGQDITEHKALEDRLRQSQKMEAVGQLTSGVAHDFNNLLLIMLGNAELLGAKIPVDEISQQPVAQIKDAVDRASSLTQRLLAFSRQQTLSPVAADVAKLIGGIEDMLRRTLGETITISLGLASDLWSATIDSHQFESALVNLAINARDAMPEGGALTIETENVVFDKAYARRHEEVTPGDYVKVSVHDTGAGMSREVLNKVFEPFFTTKDVGEGSGLGLSMVYGFVKQSNGHITIDSEIGHGATINIYVPRAQETAAIDEAMVNLPEIRHGKERILVVEDDENVRLVPVSILRDQGYEVIEAMDGEEAMAHITKGESFDLLFTDVLLPGGMNGVEIAKEIKRIQPGIKVLYTTGYAENTILREAQLNPDEFVLPKPYMRTELLDKIRVALDG